MASQQTLERNDSALRAVRTRTRYNDAEQQFSLLLQQRLDELLEAQRNYLPLLRRYPDRPDRLGVMTTPEGIARERLRLEVVEALVWDAVTYICADARGGPISQRPNDDASLDEVQMFSTSFPHIVMQRTDRFTADGSEPLEITWCLRRVQNQREQTRLNRLLDTANLGIELVRMVI